MDDFSSMSRMLENWQVARDKLAAFEALHLTLLFVSLESGLTLDPTTAPPEILREWRTAVDEAHSAYRALLDALETELVTAD